MIRLYISEPTPVFASGLRLGLNPDQSRYLASVMRLHVNDGLAVFNGRDGEWLAHLADIGKKSVTLELQHPLRTQTADEGPVLVVALIKRGPLETIIEKATELGVRQIHLVITHRSNANHTNVERLELIAKESAEQTERLNVPTIFPPVKLENWLLSNDCKLIFFGDENSTHAEDLAQTRSLLDVLQRLDATTSNAAASMAVLIGPEGGFDEIERQMLRAHPKIHPVNLGPRILRADTAAISALTLVQAAIGDWR
ncbi:MAG: 16S rRNA (uracil(1498)-N(3))-methyltransferase [Asticcacaulis sp.]